MVLAVIIVNFVSRFQESLQEILTTLVICAIDSQYWKCCTSHMQKADYIQNIIAVSVINKPIEN